MRLVHVVLDRDVTIGATDRRLFGAFVEHLGRCIYGGLFEPGHPQADHRGFRRDVLALARELGPTIIRYPAEISSLAMTGRTGSAGSRADRGASSLPGCRPRPICSAPTNSSIGAGWPRLSRCSP